MKNYFISTIDKDKMYNAVAMIYIADKKFLKEIKIFCKEKGYKIEKED